MRSTHALASTFSRLFAYPGIREFMVVFFAYGLGIWAYSVPFVGDEKVYLSTAMEMREKGSLLFPYLFGETSYIKPPWLYWTLLAGWKLFGFNLVGTFFFSVFATAATAMILTQISTELDSSELKERITPHQKVISSVAGIWFAGCTGTLTYGTSAQMEIWVVFFSSLAWLLFLKHHRTGEAKWLALGFLVCGLSGLNKSPLYSVFSVTTYYAYLLFAPRPHWMQPSGLRGFLKWLFSKEALIAHFLGVGVGLSWFAVAAFLDRERFWSQYIIQETLSKKGGNPSTIFHQWMDFSTFTIPFTLLLIAALFRFPQFKKRQISLLLCWSLLPALFFSVFPYRTETYLYILIPPLSLILDWGLRRLPTSGLAAEPRNSDRLIARVGTWIIRGNGIIMGLVFTFLAWLTYVTGLLGEVGAGLILGAGLSFTFLSWKDGSQDSASINRSRLAYASLGMIVAVRIGAILIGESDLKDLREVIAQSQRNKLAFLDEGRNQWNEVGLLAVAVGAPAVRTYNKAEAKEALKQGAILVLTQDQNDVFTSGELILAGEHFWWRLQRRFAIPSYQDLREVTAKKNRRRYKLLVPTATSGW
jgi:4-amino-4-deoxy-L-arabinose transferase-like glycosyltransferase